jgi:hypothetical protein
MFRNFLSILLFFQVITVFNATAQLEIDRPERYYLDSKKSYFIDTADFRNTISLHGSYEINSNSITNSFVKTLLSGGFISDEKKDDVSNKLKEKNRAGLDNYYGITGTHQINDYTVIAGLGIREHLDMGFTSDLFQVLFRGNKGYANKTAELGSSNVNYFNYQALYLGFAKKLTNNPIILGAGLSIIRGGQYQKLNIERADLFTEESGEYLKLNTNFSMDFTPPQKSYLASSGAGIALNLTISRAGEKGIFNAEVRDLGFISWKDATTIKADSSYFYEGKEINNVLDYGNYSYNSINLDSLRQEFGISRQNTKITRRLPFTFNANYTYYLSQKLHLMGGIRYLAFANYFPRIYFKGLYKIRERFILTPGILYGGYGNLNLELSATKSFNDKFLISGSVVCLEYLLIPKQSYGLAVQLNFTKIF